MVKNLNIKKWVLRFIYNDCKKREGERIRSKQAGG
jgi:hypothetical protein